MVSFQSSYWNLIELEWQNEEDQESETALLTAIQGWSWQKILKLELSSGHHYLSVETESK